MMLTARSSRRRRVATLLAASMMAAFAAVGSTPASSLVLDHPAYNDFTTGRMVRCTPGVPPCIPTPVECALGIGVGFTPAYIPDPATPFGPIRFSLCDGGDGHIKTYVAGYVPLSLATGDLEDSPWQVLPKEVSDALSAVRPVTDPTTRWAVDTDQLCGAVITDDAMFTGDWMDPNMCGPASASPGYGVEGRAIAPMVSSTGGVVASFSPLASQAGIDVLADGGNAIDAAVATTFAMAVARPDQCSIGGVGEMLYRRADGLTKAIDFSGVTPQSAPDNLLSGDDQSGIDHGPGTGNGRGHRVVAVPGVVRGLTTALDRFGTIDLGRAVAGAHALAVKGVPVTDALDAAIDNTIQYDTGVQQLPEWSKTFLNDGERWAPDNPIVRSLLKQPDLAHTLDLLAEHGANAFYTDAQYGGEPSIGHHLLADMALAESPSNPIAGDQPTHWTAADLAGYQAQISDPLVGSYRGNEVLTVPPVSGGGIRVLQTLNILERFDLGGTIRHSSADHLHLLAESLKLAWSDTVRLGDPKFVSMPVTQLVSKDYAAARTQLIDMHQAKDYSAGSIAGWPDAPAGTDTAPTSPSHTASISVVDRAGNAVALTCTVGELFGSGVVVPGTGIVLNDELAWFAPSGVNTLHAGKKPLTPLAPTIVTRSGRTIFVTGGAGSERIPTGVALSISNTIDYGMDVAHAVDAARGFEFCRGDSGCAWGDFTPGLLLEDGRILPNVIDDLRARGHHLAQRSDGYPWGSEYQPGPNIEAIAINPPTGVRTSASDPRGERGAMAQ